MLERLPDELLCMIIVRLDDVESFSKVSSKIRQVFIRNQGAIQRGQAERWLYNFELCSRTFARDEQDLLIPYGQPSVMESLSSEQHEVVIQVEHSGGQMLNIDKRFSGHVISNVLITTHERASFSWVRLECGGVTLSKVSLAMFEESVPCAPFQGLFPCLVPFGHTVFFTVVGFVGQIKVNFKQINGKIPEEILSKVDSLYSCSDQLEQVTPWEINFTPMSMNGFICGMFLTHEKIRSLMVVKASVHGRRFVMYNPADTEATTPLFEQVAAQRTIYLPFVKWRNDVFLHGLRQKSVGPPFRITLRFAETVKSQEIVVHVLESRVLSDFHGHLKGYRI